MKKVSLAIFDLTDCEGCELQFIGLREKLLKRGHDFEITNWRLVRDNNSNGPFDVSFIEGSPISESDIKIVKQARKMSGKVIALGACACLGGVQSSLNEKSREENLKEIYGENYKTKSKPPKPLSYYIDVDFYLPGCPVNEEELERLLSGLLAGKKFVPREYPVCFDCKAAGNPCLFLDEGFCLGPVTRGGCKAPCPSNGIRCFGCFGPLDGANLEALEKSKIRTINDQELEKSLELFFSAQDTFKEFDITKKERRKNAS